ncbi:MAG: hypothetical protein PHW46_04215 [Candidatus Omnitrophica bacterium]|nr:hypothetical protein [Candidatus Omnitrophota bacterium]
MRKFAMFAVVGIIAASFVLTSCGPCRAANSQQAVEKSQTIKDPAKRAKYLIEQAQLFFKNRQFDEAILVAKQVLSEPSKYTQEATSLMLRAQDAIMVQKQQKLDVEKE